MTENAGSVGQTTQTTEASEPGQASSKPRPLNILICIPSLGYVKSGFAFSLARAMSFFAAMPYDGEKKVDVTIIRSSQLTEMRTRLVSRAYELEATHILWLDTDMKFPPDTIPRLLNHNVPVVAVNYPTKDMEARPTAYAENEHYIGPVWTTEKTTGLAEVTHAGMGIMLTDIRVFDLLDPPLFQFEPMPPDFIKQTGEDVYFCRKVREKGIPIFIDHDLSKQVAHIGDFEYTNSFSAKAEETKQQLYKELP